MTGRSRGRRSSSARSRAQILAGTDSRAASNELLAGLRRGGFGPHALGAIVADATMRSWREAAARGALPAAGHRLGTPATVALALATDFADGKIARGTGAVTRFGAQGDFLADTALWTWFVVRHERSTAGRIATFAAWAAPVIGVAAASVARGGMVDLPRSRWFRPAAAVEVLIGGRVLWRWWASRRAPERVLRKG